MKIKKQIIRSVTAFLLIITGLLQTATAQEALSSPYSRYGIGNTNVFSNAFSSSIGGVGYALSRNNIVNFKNPASYCGVDTMSFVFDVGFHADFLTMSSSKTQVSGMMGALSHIAFAFPVTSHLKMAAGLVPLSDIDYEASEVVQVSDTTFYRKQYDGYGGLNKVLLGAAYDFAFSKQKDNLSLGLNVEYLFGRYTKRSALIFNDNTDTLFNSTDTSIHRYTVDSSLYNSRDGVIYDIKSFNFNIGLQYFHTFNNGDRFGIGGSYVLPLSLNTNNTRQFYTFVSSNGVESTRDIVMDSSYSGKITFPQSFGLGLSYEKPKKFFIGADAQFTQWSQFRLQSEDAADPLLDSWNIGFGSEITPDIYGNYFAQMTYRIGLNYDEGYMSFDNDRISTQGTRIKQYSVALGLGFPVRKSSTLINLSFEYGIKGTTANNLIRENFFRIGLSLSAKDRWFFKRKYQ
ncbi:MAG: hypothetical protein LBR17_06320 [Bacteroidales bacterium]|jgi:hypothetical protein|nr:hypothetical protein [Bacteroidales bacterium]